MKRRFREVAAAAFVVYLANTAYITAAADATLVYVAGVIAHVAAGILLTASLVALVAWYPTTLRATLAPAAALLIPASALGVYLAWRGNTSDQFHLLAAHIIVAAAGTLALLAAAVRRARVAGGGWARFSRGMAAACVALIVLPGAMRVKERVAPNRADRIRNPMIVPVSMHEEGGGPVSPFFPSSAKTSVGGTIPSNFFMDSESCGECHREIYEQWNGSMHHFASFNNQFYRKSIEYMQDVVGTEPSKWCAGCHDHAVFFNGRFERPIKEQIDTPEAHAGLACTSCHSITHVDSSMGNGGFTIEYPPLHELATSRNRVVRAISKVFTYLDPEPHRRSFMKPFMRQDSAEFCSTCHKVHLDVPVNKYRWMRGFNDYDSWQASGVSGQGARSFYYPERSSTCTDCHMPLVASSDPAAHQGKVHSHRFPAANTAVPFVNHDRDQLEATEKFLKSGFISVDIFAVTPADEGGTRMIRRAGGGPVAMTTFAVGEEAEHAGVPAVVREVGRVAAPVDRAAPHVAPGTTVRVDVVVRTRRIGHFFPGGTVDSFDVWLELLAHDADGRLMFWSGKVEEEGRGPVEAGAHFYRSYLLDGEGNPINKRNAWQARSLLYTRLIPPGAADVAHFRVPIPDDAKGPITLTAKLNHRKFSHYYTQFAYAGRPRPGQSPALLSASFNSLEYLFDASGVPTNVSGRVRGTVPVLPIVTLAESSATLGVEVASGAEPWTPVLSKTDRERWNDWGIGLLLQGDLKGAEYAFRKVTELEPEYPDGWLNVARALIQEGQTEAAKPFIAEALRLDASLGRVHYFRALVQKADGDYDGALASLERVVTQFPRDRVVLNQMARLLFLKRRFADAIAIAEQVCLIDPEDVQMHYTMMLCYRALGDTAKAARAEQLFRRFKADEASQAITAIRRAISPEDNNERQPIHDHDSVPLAGGPR
jgi:Flp pilus assembly protein TadD